MNLRAALIGVVAVVLASTAIAQEVTPPGTEAKTAPAPVALDGRWLRSGLQAYDKLRTKDPAAITALAVLSYVRGVIEVTNSNIALATLAAKSLNTKQKDANGQKANVREEVFAGTLNLCYGMFAPLSSTAYVDANLQIDQIVQITLNYLDAHPEQWDKSAHELIIAALVDKFAAKTK